MENLITQTTQWKTIEGFENYEVSNDGQIRNGSKLKTPFNHEGYLRMSFYKKKKQKCFLIHRLVAIAFLPKEEGKEFVNHKDGDKTNNNVTNLEWCTNMENVQHAYNLGLKKRSYTITKKEKIKLNDFDIELIRSGKLKINQLSKIYHRHRVTIRKIINFETYKVN